MSESTYDPDASKKLQDLLNQIAKGCHQSASTIYREHQRAVYAFIRLRIGDEHASEEILNDTFMVALTRPHRYDHRCEYRTWLIGIAKRLCSNWLRHQKRQIEWQSESLDLAEVASVSSESMTALEQMEAKELRQAMYGCIDKLPERQREALFWAWHEDLKHGQIANLMRCSEGAIKAHLHHARKKVAQCIARVFGVAAHG